MELLEDVADFVFCGAIDYRDIAKMEPDSADVSTKGNDQKWKKRIALATNALGVVAAPAAISAALKDKRLKSSSSSATMRSARGIPLKAVGAVPGLKGMATNRKVMAAGAVGGVGLQLGNATGDAISAKFFADEERKNKKKIKKLLDDRRDGLITSEEVVKRGSKTIDAAVRHQLAMNKTATKTTSAGKKMILVGTGMLTGAGSVVGYRKARGKNINPKVPKIKYENALKDPYVVKSDLTWEGEISKIDEDKRQVFGWCSLSKVDGEEVVDRQGDFIPLDEVEKSAYEYVVSSRKGGDMHRRDGESPLQTSDMIESFVVTPEKLEKLGLEQDAMPHGWWVGFKVNDDSQWESIKKGDRGFFSIHGSGKRKERNASQSSF